MAEHNVRARANPTQIRDTFKSNFNGPGAVEWQQNYTTQH